jgi:hypothetical protein
MKKEERRRRPRERERHTHTHRAEPGRDIKWPFFFLSSHSPVKFQTKAATSKQGEIVSRVGSLLPPAPPPGFFLLPIYPS